MQQGDEGVCSDARGVVREELHWRRIDMRGFRRSDGLFEVEGRMTDRKTQDLDLGSSGGRRVTAHDPIHDMGVRIVFDTTLVVHEISTFSEAYPYVQCPEGGRALQAMKGVAMTAGWGKQVRERLGGARSCTHLRELLMPLATVAYQSLGPLNRDNALQQDATGKPLKINSCYAYGEQGALVQRLWPQYHRPALPKEQD